MILIFIILVIFNGSRSWEDCTKVNEHCRCDNNCIIYGDCCQSQGSLEKIGVLSQLLSCKRFSNVQKIWTLNNCPDKKNKFFNLCRKTNIEPHNRLKSLIPVVTGNGEIFENAFCALCNYKTEFVYINVTVKCVPKPARSFQEINRLINNGEYCNVSPEVSTASPICRAVVSKCPTNYASGNYSNKNISDLCEKNSTYAGDEFTDGNIIYKNKHCCACWNKTCSRFRRANHSHFVKYSNEFSYLLNFNEWDKDSTTAVNSHNLTTDGNQTASTIEDRIVYYASFTFTLLSVLSLVVLIVIYLSHDIFRNFSGSLTVCLSTCLLMLHLLNLLTANDLMSGSVSCRYIGIFQHFIALSTFIWMAIYALDLVQTFAWNSPYQREKKTFKHFLVYSIIGFGLAGLIVGAATVTEYNVVTNSTVNPRYGGRHCWFTSMMGGIIWYFGPVCILISWNLVACIVVFYHLSKSKIDLHVGANKEPHRILLVCLKLTSVFGVAYLFQIIAVLSSVKWLIIVGSLLNCLQGTFVALCFVWTKRVYVAVSSKLSSVTILKSSNHTSINQKEVKRLTSN